MEPDLPEDAVEVLSDYLDDETESLPDGYKVVSKVLKKKPGSHPQYRITVEIAGQLYRFDWEPA